MKTLSFFKIAFFCLVLFAGLRNKTEASIVVGQTVGIDFGSIAPAEDTNFNQFDAYNNNIADNATLAFSGLGINEGVLIDTTGANVAGLGFIVENQSGQSTNRADVTNGTTGPAPFNDSSIFQDSIISNNTSSNPLDAGGFLLLTFTGLDDTLTYDLTAGFDGNNGNFNSTFSFNSASAGITTTQNDGIDSFLSSSDGDNFQTVTGLQTDGSGDLVIQVTRSNHVNVGALTLTGAAIPEPSSILALLAFLKFALLTQRVKRV